MAFWSFWNIHVHYRVNNCWPLKAMIRDLGPSLGFRPRCRGMFLHSLENYFLVDSHTTWVPTSRSQCQVPKTLGQAFNPNTGDETQSGILFNSIYSVDKANSSIKWQVGNRNRAISPTRLYVERLMKLSLSRKWADEMINRLEAGGKGRTLLNAFLLNSASYI